MRSRRGYLLLVVLWIAALAGVGLYALADRVRAHLSAWERLHDARFGVSYARACADVASRYLAVAAAPGDAAAVWAALPFPAAPEPYFAAIAVEGDGGRFDLNAVSERELGLMGITDGALAQRITQRRPYRCLADLRERAGVPDAWLTAHEGDIGVLSPVRPDLNGMTVSQMRLWGADAEDAVAYARFRAGKDGKDGTDDDRTFVTRTQAEAAFAAETGGRSIAWDPRVTCGSERLRVTVALVRGTRTVGRYAIIVDKEGVLSWQDL